MPKSISPHRSDARFNPLRGRDSRAPSPESGVECTSTRSSPDLAPRTRSTQPGPPRGARLRGGADTWQPPDLGAVEANVRPDWKLRLSQAPDDDARAKLLAAWMRNAKGSFDVLASSPAEPFKHPVEVARNMEILVIYAMHLHQRGRLSMDACSQLKEALPDGMHAVGVATTRFVKGCEPGAHDPEIQENAALFVKLASQTGFRITNLLGDLGAGSDPALLRRMADLLFRTDPTPGNGAVHVALVFFNAVMQNEAATRVTAQDFADIMSRVLRDAADPDKGIALTKDDSLGPMLLAQIAKSMRFQQLDADDLSVDFHDAAHALFQKFRGPGDDPRDPKYAPLCDLLAGTNET